MVEDNNFEDSQLVSMSSDDIEELQRANLELENQKKIEPRYLIGDIVEILEMNPQDEAEEDDANIDLESQRKAKSGVLNIGYERNNYQNNEDYEVGGGKQRCPRNGKVGQSFLGINGTEKFYPHIVDSHNGDGKVGDGTKRVYRRKDLEALRFVNAEEQSKWWIEVYRGLGPAVTKDYGDLVECKQKSISVNVAPRRRSKKKKQHPMSEESSLNMDMEIENTNLIDPAVSVTDLDSCTGVEGECSDGDDSDDEYNNIQKPAFYVTGEPNFDSGPPEDGLEYLRRVRWEAAQVPKVKVVKQIERSKLKKNEQTVYMPSIPDIAKCPEHLLHLKQWEDAFLADFSELRLAFSHFESSYRPDAAEVSGKQPPFSVENMILKSCFDEPTTTDDAVETTIDDDCCGPNFDKSSSSRSSASLSCGDDDDTSSSQCIIIGDFGPKPSPPSPLPKGVVDDDSSKNNNKGVSPTLSAILKMDSVARSAMLKKRISCMENNNLMLLTRSDCEWLFALCVAVDAPLDADMCAALRSLLRKSASLRAAAAAANSSDELVDDQLIIMLDILATISGRYFRQSEENYF